MGLQFGSMDPAEDPSPRSFWANFKEGFTYDDNKFKTNQLIHPFDGATYYNEARANGIGGIARGEMSARVSSLILDNTKRGKGRFGREAAPG